MTKLSSSLPLTRRRVLTTAAAGLAGWLARPRSAHARPPSAVRIAAISVAIKGQTSLRQSPLVSRVIDEGWLEKELAARGIRLEWFPIVGNDTGSVTNEALASGRVDFANYGDFPSLTLNAAGVRTKVVVPSGRGTDMFLLVPRDSGAQTIKDLIGKRISVHRGRPWDLGLQKLIDGAGLTANDFKIMNLNPQAGAAALAAGKVDAHFSIGGHSGAHLLVENGVGKIIWSTEGKPLHYKMRAELWGTQKFITEQPELTQLVANAYVKAAHWASDEKNKEAVIAIAKLTGAPDKVVRRSYGDPNLSWKDRWSPLLDEVVREHYRDVVKFALDRKLIRKPIQPEELLESRFLDTALKTLNLQDHWKPWQVAAVQRIR
ncbi:MAG TPA: ABC transporter substrate-binding protein [Polyangia bacterium]